MGRVLTNNVGLAFAPRPNFATTGSDWTGLEPNSITNFGAETTQVARSPINPNRLEQPGVITDIDAAVEFEADLTYDALRDFIEGFIFAMAQGRALSGIRPSAVTAGSYTIAATGQAAAANSLWWGSGFGISANNGLKVLGTALTAAALALEVGNQTAPLVTPVPEAVLPTSRARISFAGYQIAAGAVWAYDATTRPGIGTLTLAGLGTTAAALDLTVGQVVHFGSIAASGEDTINGFDTNVTGYARVRTIATDVLTFDQVGPDLRVAMDVTTADVADMLFGEFIRNVPVANADYLERSYDFEAAFPNLGDGSMGNTDDAYEYVNNCYANSLAFGLPLTNKATMTLGFVGVDAAPPTIVRRPTVARPGPGRNSAFNTSSDYARLRVIEEDEDGLVTDLKDFTVTITNNVSGDKIQGTVGSKYINIGQFNMVLEGTALFTSPGVPAAIRNNTPGISLGIILKSRDGVISIDIPNMSLGGGGREFPVGEAVQISLTGRAVEDPILRSAVGVSLIPVPLPDSEID